MGNDRDNNEVSAGSGAKWLSIVLISILLVFYFIFDPMEWEFMPQCLFHRFTGWQCMGCGSQRMVHSLLHGDIVSAFKANAFLICSLPFLAVLLLLEVRRKKYPVLYKKIHSKYFIYGLAILLILWLIIRNIFNI